MYTVLPISFDFVNRNPRFDFSSFFHVCQIFESNIFKSCSAPQKSCLNFSLVKYIHVVAEKWPETVMKQTFILA